MAQDPKKNSWITDEVKTLASWPNVKIIEKKCHSSEDQRKNRFYVLESNDWCNIIPVTREGNVVFVRQYRVGIDRHTIEIPGGVVDSDDSDLASAAIREMTEETGYVPVEGARCEPLGWTYPNPAVLTNRVHCFVIGPVEKRKEQELDYGEMIEVLEVPLTEIPQKIRDGEINHALILNAFLLMGIRKDSSLQTLREEMERFRST